ncbi:N-acetylmuramoyl-L-alanine amidase [Sutcliffiella deserti]|uniref:N-acetylmuramoyl-L-alanine amidase n=1 Tax=Sutcliffiella deserti TaxID=2875501 RepID=UPI001CBB63FD|nr:N-acetylmuramoyl-L-alanine amidase [Sutcliffiella deserti]
MLKAFMIASFIGIFLVSGCASNTTNSMEEQVRDTPVQVPNEELTKTLDLYSPTIETTEWFLPKENSRLRTGQITHVMLHFINDALRNPEDPYNVENVYALFEEYEVSAHYMIGRGGEIYYLVPEKRVAFHAGKGHDLNNQDDFDRFNDYSLGIELLGIGTREEMLSTIPGEIFDRIDPSHIGYTDAQYQALNKLLDDIMERHPNILRDRKHIIGHSEYAPVRKVDPGSLFDWSKIGF